MHNTNQKLIDRFYSDPEWKHVEDLILGYIEPLIKMEDVDLSQPAEHVKAEVIGRIKAYETLHQFLRDTKLVNRPLPTKTNQFK